MKCSLVLLVAAGLARDALALAPTHANGEFNANAPMSPRAARVMLLPALAFLPCAPALALAKDEGFEASRVACFPGSLTSSVIGLRVAGTLRKRGYFPYNTILGTCIGSDELNTTPSSLISILQNKLSSTDAGIYAMGSGGSSCGVPLKPDSSVAEFVSHVPTDGKLLLLVGPNVGITKYGVVGKVERLGQDEPSETCIGIGKGGATSNEAIAAATNKLYGSIWSKLDSQISDIATKQPELWAKVNELTVIGGIIVNRGHGSGISKGEDYFQPLMMRCYSGSTQTQLYDEVFGDLRTPREYI